MTLLIQRTNELMLDYELTESYKVGGKKFKSPYTIDKTFQVREKETDRLHIDTLFQVLEDGGKFEDPVIFWEREDYDYALLDGFHRWEAWTLFCANQPPNKPLPRLLIKRLVFAKQDGSQVFPRDINLWMLGNVNKHPRDKKQMTRKEMRLWLEKNLTHPETFDWTNKQWAEMTQIPISTIHRWMREWGNSVREQAKIDSGYLTSIRIFSDEELLSEVRRRNLTL